MHQPMQMHPIHPPSPGPLGPPPVNGQDELLFFDRAKKTLEGDGTYDEFLKLLNLFSRDIIDTKTLVDRAEVFLGDGDLLSQFKDLLSWEDKKTEENVPPGSMRTAAPEYYALLPPEDGQGPSYRRLQDHVSVPSMQAVCQAIFESSLYAHRKSGWRALDGIVSAGPSSMTFGCRIPPGPLKKLGS